MIGILIYIIFLQEPLNLTIDRAVEMALSQNPSIKIQNSQRKLARIGLMKSISGYLPEPYISASYSRTETEYPLFYPGLPAGFTRTLKGYTINFGINQAIFDPNRMTNIFNYWMENKRNEYLYEESVRSLVYQVKSAYISCLKAQKNVEVRRKALERAEENLRMVEIQYSVGSASKLDLLKSKTSLNRAQLELIQAETGLETAERELLNLLGIREKRKLTLKDIDGEEIPEKLPDMKKLIELAMDKRPKLLGERKIVLERKNVFFETLLSFLPSLNFGWYWRYSSEEFPSSISNFERNAQKSSGIYASLNFRFFSYPFDVLSRREELKSSEYQYKKNVLDVIREVEEAYYTLESSLREYNLAKTLKEQAEEALKLAKLQYKLGSIGILDLLDAETGLLEAELTYWTAHYNLYLAKEKLNTACGREVIK
jgi:outer membrane protein TolC